MNSKKSISIIYISIFIFLLYFIWPYIISAIISLLSIDNSVLITFILDFVLLFIILLIYKQNLKNDILDYKKNKQKYMKKGLKILAIGLICYISVNLLIGLIWSFNDIKIDNFNTMYDSFKKAPLLMFLSTILYYPIIEEIVFKKSFKEIIINKWIFITITGLLNAGFNIALSSTSQESLIFIIPNAILSMSFSCMYYETNNLTTSIIYRSIYNLIPNILALSSFAIII